MTETEFDVHTRKRIRHGDVDLIVQLVQFRDRAGTIEYQWSCNDKPVAIPYGLGYELSLLADELAAEGLSN